MLGMIAKLTKLTKIYEQPALLRPKKIPGVENLSFTIEKGEIFGLLGLNGAGKTTTLRLILGLIESTSGQLERGVTAGYLPENINFPPQLTPVEILKYLNLTPRSRQNAESEIQEVLDITGLSSVSRRRVGGFSKGMTQRLGIAQAILGRPEFLVLDEPTSGLDPLGTIEMRKLFLRLNEDFKMTILFSSHIISEVEKISHRVGILANRSLARILTKQEWTGSETLENLFIAAVT